MNLISSHKIIAVDNTEIGNVLALYLEPGLRQVWVSYPTYRYHSHCLFNVVIQPDVKYEIVDAEQAQPLTLYEWKKHNPLFVQRLNPLAPTECRKLPRD